MGLLGEFLVWVYMCVVDEADGGGDWTGIRKSLRGCLRLGVSVLRRWFWRSLRFDDCPVRKDTVPVDRS